MMKLKIISLVLLILFLLACSGNQSDGVSDVGTIVTNPSTPTTPKVTTDLNLSPDFFQPLMDTFLTEATANAPLENKESGEEGLFERVWNHFLQGTVVSILVQWGEEESLLKAVSEALVKQDVTINNTLQVIILDSSYPIWGVTTQKIEVIFDPDNQDYIRIYGYNVITNLITWHYLVKLDSNNQAITGMLTFVNPLAGLRSVEFIFDLTNVNRYLLALRLDKRHPVSGNYQGTQIHYQGNSSEFIAELAAIKGGEINTNTRFRFSYNDQEACFGAFGRDPLSTEIQKTFGVKTFGVTGTLYINEFTEVTENLCTIAEPTWDGHIFTVEDLPDFDTYLKYLGDGIALEGWNLITPALIDSCLTQAKCEP